MENEIRTQFARTLDEQGGTRPRYTVLAGESVIETMYRAKDIEPAIANFFHNQG